MELVVSAETISNYGARNAWWYAVVVGIWNRERSHVSAPWERLQITSNRRYNFDDAVREVRELAKNTLSPAAAAAVLTLLDDLTPENGRRVIGYLEIKGGGAS